MRKRLITVLLCISLSFVAFPITSCRQYSVVSPTGEITESTRVSKELLLRIAQGIDAISIGCDTSVDIVLEAMPENTPTRQKVLEVIAHIVKSLEFARVTVERLDRIENISTKQIADEIVPFLTEMKNQIDEDIFVIGIDDEETEKSVQKWLSVVILAIQSAEGMLKVYQ